MFFAVKQSKAIMLLGSCLTESNVRWGNKRLSTPLLVRRSKAAHLLIGALIRKRSGLRELLLAEAPSCRVHEGGLLLSVLINALSIWPHPWALKGTSQEKAPAIIQSVHTSKKSRQGFLLLCMCGWMRIGLMSGVFKKNNTKTWQSL